jgi:predicted transcriptional regulator
VNEIAVAMTVRWARKRAGMTQQDLAAAVGMPQPSIARIERGTVTPRVTTLVALLRATGHQLTVEPIGASRTDEDAEAAATLRAIRDEPPSIG